MKEDNVLFLEMSKFIIEKGIKSRVDFYRLFRNVYCNKFLKLSEENKEKLLPSQNPDYSFLTGINEWREFIKFNNIKSRTDLAKRFNHASIKFRKLSEEEKDSLLPSRFRDYSFIKTKEDLSNFLERNNINSRQELKKFSGALKVFKSLSKKDQNDLLLFRGMDLTESMESFEYFENFIVKNNISSRSNFKKRFNGIFKRFKINLTIEEQDNLLPKLKENHTYLKTFDDFNDYIKRNKIKSRWDMKKRVYDRFLSVLTIEEQNKLLPYRKIDNTYTIKSIEDLENLKLSDFRGEYKNIYKEFCKLYKNITNEQKILFNSENTTKNHSFGEKYLVLLFIKNNIKFESEKTFSDLKNILNLRFDFYLPNYNMLIEYQGEQHFLKKEDNMFCSSNQKYRDNLKYEYAKNNNINVIYFTLNKRAYRVYGYFTEVITDPDILINKIKEIGLTNQSLNTND